MRKGAVMPAKLSKPSKAMLAASTGASVGPAGPQGPAGPAGASGERGEKGKGGEPGQNGESGQDGGQGAPSLVADTMAPGKITIRRATADCTTESCLVGLGASLQFRYVLVPGTGAGE
jgi:Collagen triple helix repeat (20 copies)